MQAQRHIIILILFSAMLMIGGSAHAAPEQKAPANLPPDGLTATEWESIQAQITAAEYQFTPVESMAYRAPNRAQGWDVHFGETGVQVTAVSDASWTWRLSLSGYGYDGALHNLTTPLRMQSEKERLTYQWNENISEWWVNTPDGLEQGFTLQHHPQSPNPDHQSLLILEMAVRGTLLPVLTDDAILFQDEHGDTILRYDRLHVADAAGCAVPAYMEIGDSPDVIHLIVDDSHATYPLTIDPWLEQQKLNASDAAAGDAFGFSVAVSGDTAVIGAYNDFTDIYGGGSAYVFTRSGGTWSEQQKLVASDMEIGGWFGYSVAVSADTIVVGAPYDFHDGFRSGSAYVFVRTGEVWNQQQKLVASDAAESDLFGHSVALSENTTIIGAIFDDDGGSGSGATYIFVRSTGVWNEQQKLTASDAAAGDNFGYSVSLSADTAIIGAIYDDDGGSDSGAAYVFVRLGEVWSEQQKLTASDAAMWDWFGTSVAVSGDTIVIGSFSDNNGGGGSVYVFVRSAGAWSEQQRLSTSNLGISDNFGRSVAVSGDTVVVGAYQSNGIDSGSAYMYERCIGSIQSGTWNSATTWDSSVSPTIADGVCVSNGHTVTLEADSQSRFLYVENGGTLDLSTHSLSAEESVTNYGTMLQTRNVAASSAINFLQIQPDGGGADRYRGLDITTDGSSNLGLTTVRIMGNTAVCNNNDGGSYRDRCFMASPTNSGSAAVTLHTTAAEDDIADDAFFQWVSGTTWGEMAACNDAVGGGGTCTETGIAFSGPAYFLIGSQGPIPTAVTVQSFAAAGQTAPWAVLLFSLIIVTLISGIFLRRHAA